jgi:NAD(P)-dependent dehydrogenase (short-subunit alcohol dehydrogenase family)
VTSPAPKTSSRGRNGDQDLRRTGFSFNNAGIEQPAAPAADITEEQWDRVVAVSLRGVFLSMKYEIPALLQRGGGAIVNGSSPVPV